MKTFFGHVPIAAITTPRYCEKRMNAICDGLFARGFEWVSDEGEMQKLEPGEMTGAELKGGVMIILWRPSVRLMANQ